MAACALNSFNILPSEFMKLDEQERAFIMATIEVISEEQEAAQKEAERKFSKKH